MVGLIDNDDLEALARGNVDLLGLRNFLEQRLDNDAVVVADVGRGDFEVVDGGDDVEFDFAVGGGLEDARVDFDLFDAGAVELLEGGDDTGLFAGAGRTVDQQVGEVAGLGLGGGRVSWARYGLGAMYGLGPGNVFGGGSLGVGVWIWGGVLK